MKKNFLLLAALLFSAASFAQPKPAPAVLKASDYKRYVDYFNRMEPETIVQAVPNAQSWDFLQNNIPLFACPQDNFE